MILSLEIIKIAVICFVAWKAFWFAVDFIVKEK